MAINYNRVNWDTTKFVNPSNMNNMDAGIKSACDGVDSLHYVAMPSSITDLNSISTDSMYFHANNNYVQNTPEQTGYFYVETKLMNNNTWRDQTFLNVNTNKRFYRKYSGGAWSDWVEYAKATTWTKIQDVDNATNTSVDVSIAGYTDIMVEYGVKNGAQSYGGGIIVGGTEMNKPCIVPVCTSSAVGSISAMAYIFFQGTTIHVSNFSNNGVTLRFRIYGK